MSFFNGRGILLILGIAGLALILLVGALSTAGADDQPVTSGEGQTISAKALSDHGCDSTEWHFIINQVRLGKDYAPADITVTFGNGDTERVTLDKFTGKVAHYTTHDNLDSVVTQATARIYDSWSGQFNLSHGPCEIPTSTPTPTPVLTPTPTVTLTPTPTPIVTVTPTPTATSTVLPQAFPDTGGPPSEGDIRVFIRSDYAWFVGLGLVGVVLLSLTAYLSTRR